MSVALLPGLYLVSIPVSTDEVESQEIFNFKEIFHLPRIGHRSRFKALDF